MARADIVLGYTHVCRKRGCKHREEAPDAELRRCPTHGHTLWPKLNVRPIGFHDLRHTTASLLQQSNVPMAVVQKVLRHRDPRLTSKRWRGPVGPLAAPLGVLHLERRRIRGRTAGRTATGSFGDRGGTARRQRI
jgi:integrase